MDKGKTNDEAYNKIRFLQTKGNLAIFLDDVKVKQIEDYKIEKLGNKSKLMLCIIVDEVLTTPKN